jgi:hypothetical protein
MKGKTLAHGKPIKDRCIGLIGDYDNEVFKLDDQTPRLAAIIP